MSEVVTTVQDQPTAGAAVSVPTRFLRFISRLTHLKPGRYIITLSLYSDRCDWSISEAAKIEH